MVKLFKKKPKPGRERERKKVYYFDVFIDFGRSSYLVFRFYDKDRAIKFRDKILKKVRLGKFFKLVDMSDDADYSCLDKARFINPAQINYVFIYEDWNYE